MDERAAKRIRLEEPIDDADEVIDDETDFYSESNSPEKKDQYAASNAANMVIDTAISTLHEPNSPLPLSASIPGLGDPKTASFVSRLTSPRQTEDADNATSDLIDEDADGAEAAVEDSDFDVYTPQADEPVAEVKILTADVSRTTQNGSAEATIHVERSAISSNRLFLSEDYLMGNGIPEATEDHEEPDLYSDSVSRIPAPRSAVSLVPSPLKPSSTTSEIALQEFGLDIGKQLEPEDGVLSSRPEAVLAVLEAAQENQKESAEWRFDPSDAESGASSDSSDSTSDSSDEDGGDSSDEEEGLLLNPEEQARILMQEAAEGETGAAPEVPPRTTNEEVEKFVPKPDVTVTPEMQITKLGPVDHIIDHVAVIKADVSGEFKVLDAGSVLCLEDRTVIGAIAETLGPVRKPLYTVGFSNEQDLKDCRVETGTKVFYVNDHSAYVFTKPLQLVKGTDASNVHDEEIGHEEIEFSDDEKEAEYKRSLKQAKISKKQLENSEPIPIPTGPKNDRRNDRGGRYGQRGFRQSPPSHPRKAHPDSTVNSTPSVTIKYDDDDDDMYQPLRRPDNLQELMTSGPPEIPRLHRGDRRDGSFRGGFNNPRGGGFRGRDRGRGRGGKFAGNHRGGYDGDFSRHSRGGDHFRGPKHLQTQRQASSSRSPARPPQDHQRRQASHSRERNSSTPQSSQHQEYRAEKQYSAAAPQPQPQPQTQPSAATYSAAQYSVQQTPTTPAANPSLPAGSHINPAFFVLQNLLQSAAQAAPTPATPQPNPLSAYPQPFAAHVAPPANPLATTNNQNALAALLQQYQQPVHSLQPMTPAAQPPWPGYSNVQPAYGASNQTGYVPPQASAPQTQDPEAREAQERLRMLMESMKGQGGAWGQQYR
jgi:H/ACA ribonucleoprotein complex non-core subunit NAF1